MFDTFDAALEVAKILPDPCRVVWFLPRSYSFTTDQFAVTQAPNQVQNYKDCEPQYALRIWENGTFLQEPPVPRKPEPRIPAAEPPLEPRPQRKVRERVHAAADRLDGRISAVAARISLGALIRSLQDRGLDAQAILDVIVASSADGE